MSGRAPVVLTAAVACALVAVPAATGGGYDPSWWGWLAFVPLAIAAAGFALRPVAFSRADVQLAGGLALFVAWSALSASWSHSAPRTIADVERDVIYVASALALLVLRRSGAAVVAGVLAATGGIAAASLGERLVEGGAERLDGPLIYWNALGILCAAGLLLAVGVAAGARRDDVRAAAGAATVVFGATLYLTYSRGALMALAAGLVLMFALDPRRIRSASVAVAVAPASVVAGALAAHAPRALAALAVAVLAAVAGAGAVKAPAVERRLERSSQRRTAALAAIAAVAAFALGGILAAGGPSAVAARAADSFRSTPSANVATSDKRLLTLSDQGRLEYWRVAWRAYTSEPLRGTGAGTYELAWHRERTTYYDVRDAHNLYLEQLSETGPLGLALLVGALAAPFAGARATRRRPLGPAVLAAYSAILLHAVVDWDWEMPAVVAAGIACGVAAISLARSPRRALAPTTRALAAAALGVLAVAALGVQIANTAQSHAYAALHEGRFAAAEADAGRALRFAPWTSEPLRVRGEAELAQHRSAAAAEAFRTAIRKDPRDWHLWFDLATVSSDGERAAALKRALRLDPLEPALLDFAGALRAARLGPIIQR